MLHHISVGVADVVTAARFYDETLGALGYKRVMNFLPKAVAYGGDAPVFWVQVPRDGQATHGNGAHVAFMARSRADVDAFHAKALEMGATDNGAPAIRPDYGPDYYGAFVIDPDGNRIEAVATGERKTRARVAGRSGTAKRRGASPGRAAAGRKAAKGKTKASGAGRKGAAKRSGAVKRRPSGRKPAGRGRTRR